MTLVRSEIVERVALVTLCDPDRRNALNLDLVDELLQALEGLDPAAVGALVIGGEGSAFCAGADLDVLERADEQDLTRIYSVFRRIYEAKIPSIAAVNGAAVGAGVNLALACDLRIVAESATFQAGFLRLNLHPGGGHTWLLAQELGYEATAAIALFGETVDGRQAERIGLAWQCVPDDELRPVTRELARRVASYPPVLTQRVRHTINHMHAVGTYNEAVNHEADEQLWSIRQPEAREAIARLRASITGSA